MRRLTENVMPFSVNDLSTLRLGSAGRPGAVPHRRRGMAACVSISVSV